MAWNYTEPQLRRRPLDTPVRPAGGGGTGGPPTGPAGGDLVGAYPNPSIGPGVVGDAEISDVAWTKVTGAPAPVPGPPGPTGPTGPTGPAGDPGATGAPGVGVPAGGATGTVLTKSAAADYATMWAAAAGGVVIGPTAPPAPTPGMLWWRNDPDGNLYVYYNDGTSAQFVPAMAGALGAAGGGGAEATAYLSCATGGSAVPGGSSAAFPVANQLVVWAFIPAYTLRQATKFLYRVASYLAASVCGVALYDATGARIATNGGIAAPAAAYVNVTGLPAFDLVAGRKYYLGVGLSAANGCQLEATNHQGEFAARFVANVATAANPTVVGVPPATLGTLTAATSRNMMPVVLVSKE